MNENATLAPGRLREQDSGRIRERRWSRRVADGVAVIVATVMVCATVGVAHADGTDETASPSAGCHLPTTGPGRSLQQVAAAGKSGSYIQDVPAGADQPLPVVVDLHGYMEPATIAHDTTGLAAFGAEHGFVTVTPQLDDPGVPRWDFAPNSTDVAYLSALLTHVESTLCTDLRRVYVTGMSMGAFTASSLACQLSDRIAAIAAVAGLQDFDWCRPTRPVPVVAFHGTSDPLVAYTGGPGVNARLLPPPSGSAAPGDGAALEDPGPHSVPENTAAWARRNDCGTEPTERRVATDVTLTSYPCPATGNVELYTVADGGHSWPGTGATWYPEFFIGRTTHSIDATGIIWDFFRAHSLPR